MAGVRESDLELRRLQRSRNWTALAVALLPVAGGLINLFWKQETYVQAMGVESIVGGLTAAAGLLHASNAYLQGKHIERRGRDGQASSGIHRA